MRTKFWPKPEGERPFGRRWHRWEGSIIVCGREIFVDDVDLMHLAHDKEQS
jgi:sigma54-dependent transcription regulator